MLELRPEVRAFAELMETKLREYDDRPGWKQEGLTYLILRLDDEYQELEHEFATGRSIPNISAEAADVANFCMMIVDVLGGLPVE